jgi:hypothetical protein
MSVGGQSPDAATLGDALNEYQLFHLEAKDADNSGSHGSSWMRPSPSTERRDAEAR